MHDDIKIIQIMPAGGWQVRHVIGDQPYVIPLLGWGLLSNGEVVPLDMDDKGIAEVLDGTVEGWSLVPPGGWPEDRVGGAR